jgi:uracil-DNA glycosylase
MTEPRIRTEWRDALATAFADPRMGLLSDHLKRRKAEGAEIYPPNADIFAALDAVAPDDVRVVILGQDPYHGPGQAHGLSFSVRPGVPVPPSLANIHKELRDDIGIPIPSHGSLSCWAQQGVLLLNSLLTVERGAPLSHKGKGWEQFTDAVIAHVAASQLPTVFMLWGAHAQKKARNVDEGRHLVIRSVHPSPLSAHGGFFGSRPFSRANDFLRANGRGEIDWSLK